MFSVDPLESAQEAGLRYMCGGGRAIRRVRCGKAFRYLGPDGKPLRDQKHLERIRKLAIPNRRTRDVSLFQLTCEFCQYSR